MADRVSLPDSTSAHVSIDWRMHWRDLGQPWRTAPPIDEDREQFLRDRLAVAPDVEQGIYPFKGVKLSRADVEWLLAESQAGAAAGARGQPAALDLRGADLRRADLSGLPLAGLIGGLPLTEWLSADDDQRATAGIHLERASLREAHLERAVLMGAHLWRVDCSRAHLEGADLVEAHLERARLREVHLEGARAYGAHLEQAELVDAHLEGADLHGSTFFEADLTRVHLEGTILHNANLEAAKLVQGHLGGMDVPSHDLDRIRRSKPDFLGRLEPSDLRGCHFNALSDLLGINLGDPTHGWVQLVDVRWGDAILTVIDWSHVLMLGDEQKAHATRTPDGTEKPRYVRLAEYETATRANRQLAIALLAQGLREQAARFLYRAAVLHRTLLWWQLVWKEVGPQQTAPRGAGIRSTIHNLGSFLLSLLLDLVSGYGQKPYRCLLTYVVIVVFYTVVHYEVGAFATTPSDHLTWVAAFALSIQNLHGRVYAFRSGDPQMQVATAEAITGLLIESTIVGLITRRILGDR